MLMLHNWAGAWRPGYHGGEQLLANSLPTAFKPHWKVGAELLESQYFFACIYNVEAIDAAWKFRSTFPCLFVFLKSNP